VIRSTGELGGYAWGPERKRVMLALETTRQPRVDGGAFTVNRSRRTA
jgi:hypothetical protein